jgi:hypothetical protein
MQSLYSPKKYPADLARKISYLSPLAISIANRWMLGWPEAVKALIVTGEYMDALREQEAQERRAMDEPGLNHLSSWEKAACCQSLMAPRAGQVDSRHRAGSVPSKAALDDDLPPF